MSVRRFLFSTFLALSAFTATGCGVNQPGTAPLGSPCVRNSDCLVGICSDALCVLGSDRACDPGQRRCNGDLVEECRDTGDGWERIAECDTGCTDGGCSARVCDPLDRKCEGNLVMQCLPNGTGWTYLQACSTTCDATTAACSTPACTPFETRCHPDAPNVLQTCNERGTAWTDAPCGTATDDAVCAQGRCLPRACTTLVEGGHVTGREQRCRGDVLEQCNDFGSAFESVELCEFGCGQTGATASCADAACSAGDTVCDGSALLRCPPSERGFEFVKFCPSGCTGGSGDADCIAPACAAYTRRCGGTANEPVVEQCRADGTGYVAIEACTQTCAGGACVVSHAGCTPGESRCKGKEVEECVRTSNGGTEWAFVEMCLGSCSSGACDAGGACGCEGGADPDRLCGTTSRSPITLRALLGPVTSVPADGVSTVLVHSDPIVNAAGEVVPDGTLVTFTHSGVTSLFASADADPFKPGLQRPTLGGRARVLVRAPEVASTLTLSASGGERCSGSTTLTFSQAMHAGTRSVFVAEDFSTTNRLDRSKTTAQWDVTASRVKASPVYSFGTGGDGNLVIPEDTTFDLWSHASRYGYGQDVLSLGTSEAWVSGTFPGLSPGDEVLLVAVTGSSSAAVGTHEFKRVANIEGTRVTFSEPVRGVYGPSHNGHLGDQRVVLQRVPQFRNVTVGTGAQLTTTKLVDGGSGIVAFRATGTVRDLGRIHADNRGLPTGTPRIATSTPALNRLLHGAGGTALEGGGIVVVAAREFTVRQGGAGSQARGEISASSRTGTTSPTETSGGGGSVWIQAGVLDLAANGAKALGANASVQGAIRLDYAQIGTGSPSSPAAFHGQSGPFVATSNTAYTVPYEGDQPVAQVKSARVLGAIGGTGTPVVGLPSALPGIVFSASVDGGASWVETGDASVSLPAPNPGDQRPTFHFRLRLVNYEDVPLELHGAAWQLEVGE